MEIKEEWRRFRKSEPGWRFQERYHRRAQSREGRSSFAKILKVAGGIAVVAGGLLLVPLPGPGWVIVFAGLALLSNEFLSIARMLDWGELAARRGIARIRGGPRRPRPA